MRTENVHFDSGNEVPDPYNIETLFYSSGSEDGNMDGGWIRGYPRGSDTEDSMISSWSSVQVEGEVVKLKPYKLTYITYSYVQ